MKKASVLFIILLSMILTPTLRAQNIQLHYDFGSKIYDKDYSERPLLTSTIEKFHLDKWGNTFFFVDMDYTSKGVTSAYMEIARELQYWKGPFSAHIEFNGGLAKGFSYNNAWLAGPTYTYNNNSFTQGFTLSAMYKYIQKHKTPSNFQLTGTWYMNFSNDLYTFTGFADLWREDNAFEHFFRLDENNLIFLAEPQFWVNLNKLKNVNDKFNLSIGTEVKISSNFGGMEGCYVIPTLALKWTM